MARGCKFIKGAKRFGLKRKSDSSTLRGGRRGKGERRLPREALERGGEIEQSVVHFRPYVGKEFDGRLIRITVMTKMNGRPAPKATREGTGG